MLNQRLLPKIQSAFNRTNVISAISFLALAFFTYQMARITAAYIPYNTDVGFLRIKQQYIEIDHWRIAFFVHVYTSIWVLFAGFTQFSQSMRSRFPKLHRVFGYVYAADILLITGPAGLIMGFYANGGPTSKVAFILLALLWIYFTGMAVIKARKGDYDAHRDYMIRSYALTLSALTLRAWKWSVNNSFELPPMDVYRTVAWLGWVPNLMLAEFLIWRYKVNAAKRLSTARAAAADLQNKRTENQPGSIRPS
ncbi:MAG: DUF2306 domain-containing protein [Chloracidobacterium sp.]|nr:DUF2306 domain-containing protein [Chloracidobacterium sp.]